MDCASRRCLKTLKCPMTLGMISPRRLRVAPHLNRCFVLSPTHMSSSFPINSRNNMAQRAVPNVQAKVIEIESLTGYTFTGKRLVMESVQMASTRVLVQKDDLSFPFESAIKNTRLSILGDAVLAKLLCGIWINTRDAHGKAYCCMRSCVGH
jgi:hypothetical protein